MQTARMVVQADGERAETAEATATVVTATRAGAVAGQGVGAIGQTVQMAAGNPVPGSAATGSGGSVPTAGGGKNLVRYGRGPKRGHNDLTWGKWSTWIILLALPFVRSASAAIGHLAGARAFPGGRGPTRPVWTHLEPIRPIRPARRRCPAGPAPAAVGVRVASGGGSAHDLTPLGPADGGAWSVGREDSGQSSVKPKGGSVGERKAPKRSQIRSGVSHWQIAV